MRYVKARKSFGGLNSSLPLFLSPLGVPRHTPMPLPVCLDFYLVVVSVVGARMRNAVVVIQRDSGWPCTHSTHLQHTGGCVAHCV